jgi:hypothetical protein
MANGTAGSDAWLVGPNGLSTTVIGGVEPTSVYVPVGGETRVSFPNLDLSSVTAVGIAANHAPQVVYLKETDQSFLVPPALVARFTTVVNKRI